MNQTAQLLTADDLLRRADQSMYEGKQKGKNTSVVFSSAPADEDFSAALRRMASSSRWVVVASLPA